MIKGWIIDAARTLGIQVENLSRSETDLVFSGLTRKYADLGSDLPLWESMSSSVSRKRIDGWREIAEFVSDETCILLTEKDGRNGFRIGSGTHLKQLLAECPGFEFYVTDPEYQYVLCHNHHDYLIGNGSAKKWLEVKNDDESLT